MKVHLEAFQGKLTGKMEWPENIGLEIYLVLDNGPEIFNAWREDKIMAPVSQHKCTFRWNGKYTFDHEKVYCLVAIS